MRTALLLVAFVPVLSMGTAAQAACEASTVGDAIRCAVRQRVGSEATVVVSELVTKVSDAAGVTAVPDPGARTGRPVQFSLRVGSQRVGTAVARLQVSAIHMRARRAIDRGADITAEDVEQGEGEVEGIRLERLPASHDVLKAQARRAIQRGEVLTHAVVVAPHDIRAGDHVRMILRVGPIEVAGDGRASGSGRIGDTIRVTRPGTKAIHRARITAPGVVEILQ